MNILETDRLLIRQFTPDDAPFIRDLLNDPDFLRNIGDRGVRTLDDARDYLRRGPMTSYAENGFGLWLVALKDSGVPIGMCGLIKREGLADVDIGYAYLPAYRSLGYGFEAGTAVLRYARHTLHLPRIVAIVAPDNHASIRLLQKLGLTREATIHLPGIPGETLLFAPETPNPSFPNPL